MLSITCSYSIDIKTFQLNINNLMVKHNSNLGGIGIKIRSTSYRFLLLSIIE